MKKIILPFALIAFINFSVFSVTAWAGEGDLLWKTHFGGSRNDNFTAIAKLFDGMVAVGYSANGSFGNGDWEDVAGKGDMDAIIVKYDLNGKIVWKRNFGGFGADSFESVTAVPDGIVAVGYSDYTSFGNGDWEEFERKGLQDAIMVKYDNDGNVMWKQTLGGKSNGRSKYYSVIHIADEIVAVGYSDGFGAEDWEDFTGNGSEDAIMVKYDLEGNMVWQTHFGGKDVDRFFSVTASTDGIVAAGESYPESFQNGDWETDSCKGSKDAIVVKYDYEGSVVWKKNFGGMGDDFFNSITTVWDGFVAVGLSAPNSFGTGDWAKDTINGWEADTCKGWEDAIIVKYDTDGNIVWKKNFGGAGWDCFYAVTAAPNGIIAVGSSDIFNSGDWENITGKGDKDATIVKFNHDGNVLWKKNFGGEDRDSYYAVTVTEDGVVAVGNANFNSFKTGDWKDFEGKGWEDAIMVKYSAGSTGIIEPEKETVKIKIYPNPTTGQLTIDNGQLRIENVEIFDVMGNNVSQISNLKSQIVNRKSEIVINISHLPAGLYFVKITTEAGMVVQKVIKQ